MIIEKLACKEFAYHCNEKYVDMCPIRIPHSVFGTIDIHEDKNKSALITYHQKKHKNIQKLW